MGLHPHGGYGAKKMFLWQTGPDCCPRAAEARGDPPPRVTVPSDKYGVAREAARAERDRSRSVWGTCVALPRATLGSIVSNIEAEKRL